MAPQLVLVVQQGGANDAGAGLVACATLALDEQTTDGGMPAARLADVVVEEAVAVAGTATLDQGAA